MHAVPIPPPLHTNVPELADQPKFLRVAEGRARAGPYSNGKGAGTKHGTAAAAAAAVEAKAERDKASLQAAAGGQNG